jgi:ankyrin
MLIFDAPENYQSGSTRLYHAARYGWCSAIKSLLEQGADVHLGRPFQGRTPLHAAAVAGHSNAAVLLLDAGARVNDCDQHGWTALHFAAGHNHPKMCKLLMSRGASLDARTNGGDDPEHKSVACVGTRARTTANLLAAVRAAGGWQPYVDAPRKELLALRQRLPALRDRGRAAPSSSVRAHERLFLDTPDDVFTSVLAFWRSDRDD